MNQIWAIYKILNKKYSPQEWWPVTGHENRELEIIFGAILTQNTSWKNAEKAIKNLRENNLISVNEIKKIKKEKLAKLIRSSGYHNQKSEKLKIFVEYLIKNYKGDVKKLFNRGIEELREELLKLKGIGKETADSIILYSAKKPIFVVDAYTKRIFSRIGLCEENVDYDSLQTLFYENLDNDERLFNEYHALIVKLGKEVCTKKPKCSICLLNKSCKTGKAYIEKETKID